MIDITTEDKKENLKLLLDKALANELKFENSLTCHIVDLHQFSTQKHNHENSYHVYIMIGLDKIIIYDFTITMNKGSIVLNIMKLVIEDIRKTIERYQRIEVEDVIGI